MAAEEYDVTYEGGNLYSRYFSASEFKELLANTEVKDGIIATTVGVHSIKGEIRPKSISFLETRSDFNEFTAVEPTKEAVGKACLFLVNRRHLSDSNFPSAIGPDAAIAIMMKSLKLPEGTSPTDPRLIYTIEVMAEAGIAKDLNESFRGALASDSKGSLHYIGFGTRYYDRSGNLHEVKFSEEQKAQLGKVLGELFTQELKSAGQDQFIPTDGARSHGKNTGPQQLGR